MADLIKMKPQKSYEWNQDKKFLYIQVPLQSHTSLKRVDIFLSDLILRVTSRESKKVHFLDLSLEVDYTSPENKFILRDGVLHATLLKTKSIEQWTSLLIRDISLADLKDRRKASETRYEDHIKTVEQNKSKLRIDYEHKATQELMDFEQKERNILEFRKKTEKEEAINNVFSNVNTKTGHFEKAKKTERSLELERTEESWNKKQQLALTMLEEEEQTERSNLENDRKEKNKNKIIEEVNKQYRKEKIAHNSMFTDQEIEKNEELRQDVEAGVEFEEIPIRNAAVKTVDFTERVHRNIAARDTYYKQPPMPKNKGTALANGDLQSKNPLWLKDKGDSFVKDKNFISAIEAYSEALKIDSKFINAVLNRCVCYTKVFKLQEAIDDSDQALLILQSQISGDEGEKVHSRLTLAKIKTRKALCLAWKGQLQASKVILKQVLELEVDKEIQSQIDHCLEQIKKRQLSIHSKARGDELVKLNNHKTAIDCYNKAISIDQNEYAISNKVLCLNKLQKYGDACQEAEQGIKQLSSFNLGQSTIQTKEDKEASLILLKLHYRKAKALEEVGSITEAEDNIRKGLTINSEDKDLQLYLKTLKKKQNKLSIKVLKEQSASFIKQSKIKEALQNYSKCLKMLEQAEDIQQYLAILQNQCVCYQKIEKYDDVLSTCTRILKLVNRLESKILEFGGKKQASSISKEDMKKVSVRTLVRRANAYIKTSQYYNAKSDLGKAFEISPDETIKKQLQILKSKLSPAA